jgi:hypothetical protein
VCDAGCEAVQLLDQSQLLRSIKKVSDLRLSCLDLQLQAPVKTSATTQVAVVHVHESVLHEYINAKRQLALQLRK